jgi:tRNA threonylcarbamoyl adenosine modification protein YeaZ
MSGNAQESRLGEAAPATLALVTCGPQLEVALNAPSNRGVSTVRLGGIAPRSTLVLAAVDLLVEDAGLTPEDVRTVVVSRGPGSFTGIRAGLATVEGLAAATGAGIVAYDSLLMLAARCDEEGEIWTAQPGRRGEVYARLYRVDGGKAPRSTGDIEIVPVAEACDRAPWVAAEALDLGGAERVATTRSSAESLLRLIELGVPGDEPEPLYIEGPPIHRRETK